MALIFKPDLGSFFRTCLQEEVVITKGGSSLKECLGSRTCSMISRKWSAWFCKPVFFLWFPQGGPGSVRFGYVRFGDGTVQAVPVFGSGGSSAKRGFLCVSVEFNRKGRFRFRFLENGSGGSGSAFGFGKNGSDGSGFWFRFGSVPEPPCVQMFGWRFPTKHRSNCQPVFTLIR